MASDSRPCDGGDGLARNRLEVMGRVQGVGFRFTAIDVARGLSLKGWVRNCPDGRVEAICEGEEELLKDFISKIRNYMRGYIRDEDIDWSEARDEFKDFQIAW